MESLQHPECAQALLYQPIIHHKVTSCLAEFQCLLTSDEPLWQLIALSPFTGQTAYRFKNPLALLAQAGQIRAQQQQLAEAPLRMQALQQQTQAGQLDLQQHQQAIKDDQAFRQISQDPSMQGKTIGQIAEALASKGCYLARRIDCCEKGRPRSSGDGSEAGHGQTSQCQGCTRAVAADLQQCHGFA